ncbi:hypothetical protein [Clostridium sp. D53t1_180928_C8]|uniref:hypothetical protein n=1 Tax=Clostridium sp. D53t1_180928_C8 TaxID=2787101 RepID=UPI0018AA3543|nr:hypothetical protein [Clostridium sp. D53t1_180928_C8]
MDEKEFIDSILKKDPFEDKDFIHKISVATTHLIYRNGIVEDMHADGKLTDLEMKEINIFMVNRLAYISIY